MLGSLGFPEILLILVLALLIFGPKRLPEVGRTIGKALGEFRRATSDLKRTFESEVVEAERRPPPTGSAVPRPAALVPAVPPAEVASAPAPSASEADGGAESATTEPLAATSDGSAKD